VTPREKVREILADRCARELPEALTPTDRLADDLGLDSMDMAELAMGLEAEFHFAISMAEEKRLVTVQDVFDLVERERAA